MSDSARTRLQPPFWSDWVFSELKVDTTSLIGLRIEAVCAREEGD